MPSRKVGWAVVCTVATVMTLSFVACADNTRAPGAPAGTRDGGTAADAGPTTDASDPRYDRSDGGPVYEEVDRRVTLPFGDPPQVVDLGLSTDVRRLDLAIVMDTTASFGEEIDALQRDLQTQLLAALQARVVDVAVGVARFEDFPLPPFGEADDRPFQLVAPLTTDGDRIKSAVASLDRPLGRGGDVAESLNEAAYQVATGDGYFTGGQSLIPPFAHYRGPKEGDLGGMGFRDESFRVAVFVTDAPAHVPADYLPFFSGTHGTDAAIDAMKALSIRAVGIASASARPTLLKLAIGTGATLPPGDDNTCATGLNGSPRAPTDGLCPLVYDVRENGTGVTEALLDGVIGLVDGVDMAEVYGEAQIDPLRFVTAIEAREAVTVEGTPPAESADLRPVDGVLDTFIHVTSATELTFRLHLQNRSVAPADYDQRFVVEVRIMGDGAVLRTERIEVRVPRVPRAALPDAGSTDAGSTDAGSTDAGSTDAGSTDAGSADANVGDAEVVDAAGLDGAAPDGGPVDSGA